MLVFKKKERKRKKLTWRLETRLEPPNDHRSTHSVHIEAQKTVLTVVWVFFGAVGVPLIIDVVEVGGSLLQL